jgi:hypothetical protein
MTEAQEEKVASAEPIKTETVLRRLAHEVESQEIDAIRIEVNQGAPSEWTCRVYPRDGGEFIGVLITSD